MLNQLVDEQGNIRGKSNRESRDTQIQDIIEDKTTRKVYRDGVGFIDERVG